MNLETILSIAFIFSTCLFVSQYSIKQLRKNHRNDIRIIWYLFSLAMVATYAIALWAIDNGALHQNGFAGDVGKFLEKLLKSMLDLKASLLFMLSIAALIVLPQLISYILSGLSGCAGTLFLIEGSFSFLVWGLIKSLAIGSGIIISLGAFGMWYGWQEWWQGGFEMAYISSILIMLSFAALLIYREAETVASDIKKYFPRLYMTCLKIHRWCTRHVI